MPTLPGANPNSLRRQGTDFLKSFKQIIARIEIGQYDGFVRLARGKDSQQGPAPGNGGKILANRSQVWQNLIARFDS